MRNVKRLWGVIIVMADMYICARILADHPFHQPSEPSQPPEPKAG